MKFGEKLKEAMQELGINQIQVVKLTGCSKGAVSMYINGKMEPGEEKKRGIAVSLGLAPDYFEKEKPATDDAVLPANYNNIRRVSMRELSEILGVNPKTASKIAKSRELPGLYTVHTTSTNCMYFINEAIFCRI